MITPRMDELALDSRIASDGVIDLEALRHNGEMMLAADPRLPQAVELLLVGGDAVRLMDVSLLTRASTIVMWSRVINLSARLKSVEDQLVEQRANADVVRW